MQWQVGSGVREVRVQILTLSLSSFGEAFR